MKKEKKKAIEVYNNKEESSEKFLKQLHQKQEDQEIKNLKARVEKLQDPSSLMNMNAVELSQMSEWSDRQTKKAMAAKGIKTTEKLSSNMDREGLINELNHYKKFSLRQFEIIRLLKVEI